MAHGGGCRCRGYSAPPLAERATWPLAVLVARVLSPASKLATAHWLSPGAPASSLGSALSATSCMNWGGHSWAPTPPASWPTWRHRGRAKNTLWDTVAKAFGDMAKIADGKVFGARYTKFRFAGMETARILILNENITEGAMLQCIKLSSPYAVGEKGIDARTADAWPGVIAWSSTSLPLAEMTSGLERRTTFLPCATRTRREQDDGDEIMRKTIDDSWESLIVHMLWSIQTYGAKPIPKPDDLKAHDVRTKIEQDKYRFSCWESVHYGRAPSPRSARSPPPTWCRTDGERPRRPTARK